MKANLFLCKYGKTAGVARSDPRLSDSYEPMYACIIHTMNMAHIWLSPNWLSPPQQHWFSQFSNAFILFPTLAVNCNNNKKNCRGPCISIHCQIHQMTWNTLRKLVESSSDWAQPKQNTIAQSFYAIQKFQNKQTHANKFKAIKAPSIFQQLTWMNKLLSVFLEKSCLTVAKFRSKRFLDRRNNVLLFWTIFAVISIWRPNEIKYSSLYLVFLPSHQSKNVQQ